MIIEERFLKLKKGIITNRALAYSLNPRVVVIIMKSTPFQSKILKLGIQGSNRVVKKVKESKT